MFFKENVFHLYAKYQSVKSETNMELWFTVSKVWQDLKDKHSDARTTNLPLMSSLLPTIVICLSYVFTVKVENPLFI